MDNLQINLFDDDSNEIILPNVEINNEGASGSELISEDIGKAISGDKVKSMILPEENSILIPNYVIDLSHSH